MGIAGRLAAMKAAAESRGPLDPATGEPPGVVDDGEFADLRRNTRVSVLPPLRNGEVVFSKSPEERATIADGCAGLDCETFLIQPGRAVPRLVVTGYQKADGTQQIVTGDPSDPTIHARSFLSFTEHIVENALSKLKSVDGKEVVALERVGDGVGGLLINQNIAFDFSAIAEDAHQRDVALGLVGSDESWFERVMQRIFELLDLRVVEDNALRERLLDLAEGSLGKDFSDLTKDGNPRRKGYNLKSMGKQYFNVDLDKLSWRTSYSRLVDKPLSEYADGAINYVTEDVETALHVAARQTRRAQMAGLPPGARIPDAAQQSKYAFALNLVSAWGMRTDLSKVQKLDADLDSLSRQMLGLLKDHGLVRSTGRDAGSRDMKKIHKLVEECYEEARLPVPRTKKGNISTAGSVLEDIALIQSRGSAKEVLDKEGRLVEDDLFKLPLYALSQYTSVEKLISTYLPTLYAGAQHPINTRYQTVLETGRVSSSKPNLNNMPRGGTKTLLLRLQSRVRQCFVPRPGFLLSSCDYNQLELACLSQLMLWYFGESKMADAINAGLDLHMLFAAEQLLHIPYEEAMRRKKDKEVADLRQMAKVANFSLGGGAGPNSLVKMAAASYGVYLTVDEAKELKEKWLNQWQMRGYFRLISSMLRDFDDRGDPVGSIEQFISGRVRGGARYCALANQGFQALGADGSLSALYELQKASYLRKGPLYGSRCVGYFYDETLFEFPEDRAAEYAEIQTNVMKEVMQQHTPGVKISASPALMTCWAKEAEAVYDKNGKLCVWEAK